MNYHELQVYNATRRQQLMAVDRPVYRANPTDGTDQNPLYGPNLARIADALVAWSTQVQERYNEIAQPRMALGDPYPEAAR